MEPYLIKKEPKSKPEAATSTEMTMTTAPEKRRAVALPAKLVHMFPVIANFCDTGTLLDWLSCYRPGDEDRRIIEAGFSGSICLPVRRLVKNTYIRLYRSMPRQVLRSLTMTSSLDIQLIHSVDCDDDFRTFRSALLNESLANLQTLVLVADRQSSINAPFWLDVSPSLKSLKSLKLLKINADSSFFGRNVPTLLKAMASMRALEDFQINFTWTSSLVATFLKLKWPSLKVLRSDQILMEEPPFPAVKYHDQLLTAAFANGHFKRVSHLVVGESREKGNLHDALPKDGLKQIKTLTLIGRVLRSTLLNFSTLPPGELNLNGAGGAATRSLFSGLDCLDISHLHVPDAIPFFHTVNEQTIYCNNFHENSLRALGNLTTLIGSSKLKKVMISDLIVSPSSKMLEPGQLARERMRQCRAELNAARISTLGSLAKGVKVLDVSCYSDYADTYQGLGVFCLSPNWARENANPSSGAPLDCCLYGTECLAWFLSNSKELHESLDELLLPSCFADSYRGRLYQLIFEDTSFPSVESKFNPIRDKIEDLEQSIAEYDSGTDLSRYRVRADLVQELDETKAFLDVFERCKKGGPVPYTFPSAVESRELCRTLRSVPNIVFDRSTLAGFKALRSLVFKIPEECEERDEWDDDPPFYEWMDLEGGIRLMPPCCTSLTVERPILGARLVVFPPIKQLAKPTEDIPEVKDEGRITHYFKHIRSAPQERVFQLNVTTKGSTNVSSHQLQMNLQ